TTAPGTSTGTTKRAPIALPGARSKRNITKTTTANGSRTPTGRDHAPRPASSRIPDELVRVFATRLNRVVPGPVPGTCRFAASFGNLPLIRNPFNLLGVT